MQICVLLHLSYTEMLEEMLDVIANLSADENVEYDLLVTMCREDEMVARQLYAFKDNTKILYVPNRGYDIAPFLTAIKTIDLQKYDYIIKLHSKRTLTSPAYLPTCCLKGDEWRRKLVEFMASPRHFKQTLKCFAKHPEIGMVTAPELIITAGKEDKVATTTATEIIRQMGLNLKEKKFVAGTMFMARAKLFKLWQMLPYEAQDFEEFDPNHKGGTLAHALERVLGMMIYAQGFQISAYNNKKVTPKLKASLYKLKNFLFYKRVNSKNKLHVKICKIPVYSKKVG